MDLPVRFILPDLAVLSIAQHPARTREDLRRTRSLDGRHLGGGAAEELLLAIAQGLELAPSELRLPPAHELDQPNRAVTTLATAYIAQRAADLELDPAILATRADLVEFMQDPPRGRLAGGWRRGPRRRGPPAPHGGEGIAFLRRPGLACVGGAVVRLGRPARPALAPLLARRRLLVAAGRPQIDTERQDPVLQAGLGVAEHGEVLEVELHLAQDRLAFGAFNRR